MPDEREAGVKFMSCPSKIWGRPENTGKRREAADASTGPGLGNFASVGTTGGHRGRKRSLLQGGVGVPFIARWPGRIAAGKVDDTTPLTAVDLLPTLCSIAGVELPQGYKSDGIDQSAALLGEAGSQRNEPIFWEWRSARSKGKNWPMLAVRSGAWKLLVGKHEDRIELFRFPADRLEATNLAATQGAEVERLRSLLAAWKETLPAKASADCFSKTRGE